jgi:hypothetical protein
MSTKNQGLARDPEGEIGRTGTRVSLFLPLGVILSSLHGFALDADGSLLNRDWKEVGGKICTTAFTLHPSK